MICVNPIRILSSYSPNCCPTSITNDLRCPVFGSFSTWYLSLCETSVYMQSACLLWNFVSYSQSVISKISKYKFQNRECDRSITTSDGSTRSLNGSGGHLIDWMMFCFTDFPACCGERVKGNSLISMNGWKSKWMNYE